MAKAARRLPQRLYTTAGTMPPAHVLLLALLLLLTATTTASASSSAGSTPTPRALLLRSAELSNDTVQIEAWGANALRVRIVLGGGPVREDLPGALILPGSDNKDGPLAADGAAVSSGALVARSSIRNGNIEAEVSATGLVTIRRVSDGKVLLQESGRGTATPATTVHGNVTTITPTVFEEFASSDVAEQLYGFGEHQRSTISLVNQSFSMETCLEYPKSHGGAVCVPFVLAAWAGQVQYGFLWNVPAYGGVNFSYAGNASAARHTTWTAQATTQVDYFVATSSGGAATGEGGSAVVAAAEIMHSFVDAVGHAPPLPDYAAGYWHSKNRYESSEQLVDAARGFKSRGINVSVIVVDFHHWVHMGDFAFDRRNWSDPTTMVQQLRELGIAQVMVSAWPFLAENSSGLQKVLENRWAMTVQNTSEAVWWNDNNCAKLPPVRKTLFHQLNFRFVCPAPVLTKSSCEPILRKFAVLRRDETLPTHRGQSPSHQTACYTTRRSQRRGRTSGR